MRYVPHTEADIRAMLEAVGVESLEALFEMIPEPVRAGAMGLPERGLDEMALRRHLGVLAARNRPAGARPCFLGAGVYDHYIPAVVSFVMGRSEFSTSYTPYQAEMSQGLLQGLYEFQSMVASLYGMEVCNASMYDGATALAEAVLMAADITGRCEVVMPLTVAPHYRQVVATYLSGTGLELVPVGYRDGVTDLTALRAVVGSKTACVVMGWPNFFGCLEPVDAMVGVAHGCGALVIMVALPVPLGILKGPGEFGVDIAVGEGQGLGLPMSYGGPLLGIFGCRRAYVRRMPGRLVGATVDRRGQRAYTLTLQTREQHIRREKATSNICTSQALCAIGAAVYLGLMGPQGLRDVAAQCLRGAHFLAERLGVRGVGRLRFGAPYFHEFVFECGQDAEAVCAKMAEAGYVAGYPLGRDYPEEAAGLLVCVTEKRTPYEIEGYVETLARIAG